MYMRAIVASIILLGTVQLALAQSQTLLESYYGNPPISGQIIEKPIRVKSGSPFTFAVKSRDYDIQKETLDVFGRMVSKHTAIPSVERTCELVVTDSSSEIQGYSFEQPWILNQKNVLRGEAIHQVALKAAFVKPGESLIAKVKVRVVDSALPTSMFFDPPIELAFYVEIVG